MLPGTWRNASVDCAVAALLLQETAPASESGAYTVSKRL